MSSIQLCNRNRHHFMTAILAFCILFHFTNSYLINMAIWYWNEGFYFLSHAKYLFSTFYIGLLFTRTVSRVNFLSNSNSGHAACSHAWRRSPCPAETPRSFDPRSSSSGCFWCASRRLRAQICRGRCSSSGRVASVRRDPTWWNADGRKWRQV